jgi:hypothetical protein
MSTRSSARRRVRCGSCRRTGDGREPGDTVGLSGPGTVAVHATVRSIFPLRSLEVVRNGEVVAKAAANGGLRAEIREELRIDGNSWIACRAFGTDYHLDEWGRGVFAHTSPVYVACGGDWAMTDPEGLRYIRTLVEGARDYVRHTAVRRSDQVTTHITARPTTSPGSSGRSTRPCARWTGATAR